VIWLNKEGEKFIAHQNATKTSNAKERGKVEEAA